MKRYLRIYKSFVLNNLSEIMAYRAAFLSSLASAITWGLFHFVYIYILTYRVDSAYGWKREELFLLTATFSIMWGVFRAVFMDNFSRISTIVLNGQLDSLLIKPVDSQFWVSTRKIGFDELIRIVLGVTFMVYVVNAYHMQISMINVILYFSLLLFSIMAGYSLWFSILTITVWQPRLSNLKELLSMISGLIRYPPEIFRGFGGMVVFLLTPLLFVIAVPTKALIGKVEPGEVIWFVLFVLSFFSFTRFFWKYALRSYTSVNS